MCDPVILSRSRTYGATDGGGAAMESFFANHRCNAMQGRGLDGCVSNFVFLLSALQRKGVPLVDVEATSAMQAASTT